LDKAIVPEFLERLAQAPNVHVDGALLDVDISAPDAIQELIAGVDPLRVSHEELEHPVLGRSERHRHLADQDPVTGLIQLQAFEIDTLAFTGRPDGRTEVNVVIVRQGKNLKGRMLAILLGTGGKRVPEKRFGKSVKAIEARNDAARTAELS